MVIHGIKPIWICPYKRCSFPAYSNNMNILVIEDNLEISDIINFVLEEEGYTVLTSPDGSILKDLTQIKPKLIIIDQRLNAELGSDLCIQLKANPATAAIPLLLLSALNNLEEIACQCGADAFIEKPFDLDHFSLVVKQLVTAKTEQA